MSALRRAPGPCDPDAPAAALRSHDDALRDLMAAAATAFDRGASVSSVLDRVVSGFYENGGNGRAETVIVRALAELWAKLDRLRVTRGLR